MLKTLGFSDGRILALVLAESLPDRARRRRARASAVAWLDRLATRRSRPTACCRRSICRRATSSSARADRRRARPRDRAAAGAAGQPAEDRRRAAERVMRCCPRSSPSPRQPADASAQRARLVGRRRRRHRRRGHRVRRRAVDRRGLPQRDAGRRRRDTRHRDAQRRRQRDDQRPERRARAASSRTGPGIAPRRAGPAGVAGAAT